MSLQLSTFSAMVISDSIMSIINKIIFNPDNANLKFCEKVELLEKEFLLLDQVEIPVSHEFANGMYVRQITIPKGTLAISAYHKFGQFDIMLTGRMSIITDEGISEIAAPYCKMSNHGLKRFGYAYEDTIWMDVRPLREMPVNEAEKMLFVNNYKDLCMCKIKENIDDYNLLLSQYKISADTVQSTVENKSDQICIDLCEYNTELALSAIHGTGVFATKVFNPGDTVGPARLNGYRTQFGRYINHAKNPNSVMQLNGNDIYVIVIAPIGKEEEITVNYRQALALSTQAKGELICQQ